MSFDDTFIKARSPKSTGEFYGLGRHNPKKTAFIATVAKLMTTAPKAFLAAPMEKVLTLVQHKSSRRIMFTYDKSRKVVHLFSRLRTPSGDASVRLGDFTPIGIFVPTGLLFLGRPKEKTPEYAEERKVMEVIEIVLKVVYGFDWGIGYVADADGRVTWIVTHASGMYEIPVQDFWTPQSSVNFVEDGYLHERFMNYTLPAIRNAINYSFSGIEAVLIK